jgi:hypothetical protein
MTSSRADWCDALFAFGRHLAYATTAGAVLLTVMRLVFPPKSCAPPISITCADWYGDSLTGGADSFYPETARLDSFIRYYGGAKCPQWWIDEVVHQTPLSDDYR